MTIGNLWSALFVAAGAIITLVFAVLERLSGIHESRNANGIRIEAAGSPQKQEAKTLGRADRL